jgi:uncharacterized protein YdaU (DUF1376 family)
MPKSGIPAARRAAFYGGLMGEALNYYEHHLGDYLRDTAHLSLIEDAVYRRLLDQYYIREAPLPLNIDECAKLARVAGKGGRPAVEYILHSFFVRADDGFHQTRADQEIARFHAKRAKAQNSANARWKGSERNANAMRTHSPSNALQSPDTSNKNLSGGEPPQWSLIRSEYPKRKGDQRWHDAFGAARARVKDGATWDDLLAGVRRYAEFVRADGKEHTAYVKQAATFFGKDKAFADSWVYSTPKADPYARAI